MQVITIAAAALAVAAPVAQAANAVVYNQCTFPVYLWSVTADNVPGDGIVLAPGTGQYTEAYQTPSQGGVSIKIASTDSVAAPITQFEYTLAGNIWYDISNINCKGSACPFQPYGIYLESGPGCPSVSCPGGEPLCTGAYNNPDDNWASLACDASANTTVYLCAPPPGLESRSDEFAEEVAERAPASPVSTLVTAAAPAAATAAAPAAATAAVEAAKATVEARAIRHPHQRPQ